MTLSQNSLFSQNYFADHWEVLRHACGCIGLIILYQHLLLNRFRVNEDPWLECWVVCLLCQLCCPSLGSIQNESLSSCKHRMIKARNPHNLPLIPMPRCSAHHTHLGVFISIWTGAAVQGFLLSFQPNAFSEGWCIVCFHLNKHLLHDALSKTFGCNWSNTVLCNKWNWSSI